MVGSWQSGFPNNNSQNSSCSRSSVARWVANFFSVRCKVWWRCSSSFPRRYPGHPQDGLSFCSEIIWWIRDIWDIYIYMIESYLFHFCWFNHVLVNPQSMVIGLFWGFTIRNIIHGEVAVRPTHPGSTTNTEKCMLPILVSHGVIVILL